MSRPRFSIITCTYNSEKYLPYCIESVARQKYDDFEHIFVDGFSSDKTVHLIKEYQSKDKRVQLIQAKPSGIANAMNVGISSSSGEIIQHLHSDDYLFDSESLTYVDDFYRNHPDISVLVGRSARDRNGELFHSLLSQSSLKRRTLLLRYLIFVRCYIAHPSTFIMSHVFNNNGLFNETFKIAMDYEYWMRIIRKEKFYLVNRELTVFREHPEAASSNRVENDKEEAIARELHSNNFYAFLGRYIFSPMVGIKVKLNSLE